MNTASPFPATEPRAARQLVVGARAAADPPPLTKAEADPWPQRLCLHATRTSTPSPPPPPSHPFAHPRPAQPSRWLRGRTASSLAWRRGDGRWPSRPLHPYTRDRCHATGRDGRDPARPRHRPRLQRHVRAVAGANLCGVAGHAAEARLKRGRRGGPRPGGTVWDGGGALSRRHATLRHAAPGRRLITSTHTSAQQTSRPPLPPHRTHTP